MGTFWDFCAPFYDMAEKTNGRAYGEMLKTVNALIPHGAAVLEAAAGTGAISLAVAGRASHVLCTDVSERMLNIARRKIVKRSFQNITVGTQSIYELAVPDSSFDVVIAGQVLHLIDEPEKAAAELRRVAKSMVILPMSFTKNLRGTAKLGISVYRIFGFAPRIEFTAGDYESFLPSIGFNDCEHIQISGKIPMAVAVWKKEKR
ncbi:MAG: class I SAM-dependent methyltransferase [Treponema sp.]|jgi:ubiquinone/menaquinone biosynthesis C-methylase UbiE|nr:class I SAM-dependent methyltransferase [Treponema sp.]